MNRKCDSSSFILLVTLWKCHGLDGGVSGAKDLADARAGWEQSSLRAKRAQVRSSRPLHRDAFQQFL